MHVRPEKKITFAFPFFLLVCVASLLAACAMILLEPQI